MTTTAVPTTPIPSPDPAPSIRPRAVLLDVSAALRDRLGPALRKAGYDVVDAPDIDERVVQAALVVIEAARGPRALANARTLRRLAGGPLVLGVVGWWSEMEPDVRRVSDAVLHVPVRDTQLRAVLGALPVRFSGPMLAAGPMVP